MVARSSWAAARLFAAFNHAFPRASRFLGPSLGILFFELELLWWGPRLQLVQWIFVGVGRQQRRSHNWCIRVVVSLCGASLREGLR